MSSDVNELEPSNNSLIELDSCVGTHLFHKPSMEPAVQDFEPCIEPAVQDLEFSRDTDINLVQTNDRYTTEEHDNTVVYSSSAQLACVEKDDINLGKRKAKFITPFKKRPRGKCHLWPECVKCSIIVDCGNCINCCDKSKQ